MKRSTYAVVALIAGLAFVPSLAVATPARAAARPAAKVFTRTWIGHTRYLAVGRNRLAHEWIDDGCCHHILDLTLRLSHFRGNRARGSARAIVVSVHVSDRSVFNKRNPAPHRGQRGHLQLRHGVLSEPFTLTNYCDTRAGMTGVCGA